MKKISFKAKDVGGPPEHSAWIWHTAELLRSAAWRGASLNLRRLLDHLEIEHLRQERRENGSLMALYDDLERHAGIGRRLILPSIIEGERRALIEVEHGLCLAGGRRQPSRFRLTYLPSCSVDPKTKITTWHAPTNDWRRYTEPANRQIVKRVHAENFSAMSKGEPVPVHEGEPVAKLEPSISAKNQVHESEPVTSAPSCTTSTYLRHDPPDRDRPAAAAARSRDNCDATSVIGYEAEPDAGGDRYPAAAAVNGKPASSEPRNTIGESFHLSAEHLAVPAPNGTSAPGRMQLGLPSAADGTFELFWRSYPSRGGYPNPKKPAAAKFAAAVKRGVDPDEIIAGAQRYARWAETTGTEPQFIAQALTWLNQERWQQYALAPEPAGDEDEHAEPPRFEEDGRPEIEF